MTWTHASLELGRPMGALCACGWTGWCCVVSVVVCGKDTRKNSEACLAGRVPVFAVLCIRRGVSVEEGCIIVHDQGQSGRGD